MDNRARFAQLLSENGIKQVKSAKLIFAVTNRPCSDRSVRAWLADPDLPSARKCPDWAVQALEKAVDYMQRLVARRQASGQETQTND
ncbi:hypothetical protein ALO93_200086 [Pseudomonas amygdali pv. sesami]|nr:hypothetical protein ALO93_200086 [Pseudomonas amygdali pv. sesami]